MYSLLVILTILNFSNQILCSAEIERDNGDIQNITFAGTLGTTVTFEDFRYQNPINLNWKNDTKAVHIQDYDFDVTIDRTIAIWIETEYRPYGASGRVERNRRTPYLSISKLSINSFPPNLFYHFDVVKRLSIDYENVSALEQEDFENANYLVELKLPHNHIRTLSENVFLHVKKLETVDLSGNLIEKFSQNVFTVPTLKSIDLSGNLLKHIKTNQFDGTKLTNLEILLVNNNLIEEIDMSMMFAENKFPSLTQFNIRENKLKIAKNCIKKESSNLQIFDISLNPLLENVEILVNCREVNVANVNLEECQIGMQVTVVDASFNSIDKIVPITETLYEPYYYIPQDTYYYSSRVSTTNFQLKQLNLMNNSLSDISNISSFTNLEVINLSHNLIDNIPAKAFSKLTNLRTLLLNDNQLKTIKIGFIIPAFQLIELDLSYNELVKFKINGICPKLEQLIINGNNLTSLDINFKEIAPKLKAINLSDNELNCEVLTKTVTKLEKDGIYIRTGYNHNLKHNYEFNVNGIGCDYVDEEDVIGRKDFENLEIKLTNLINSKFKLLEDLVKKCNK